MPTLILTPRYTEDTQALWRAAGQLGWQVERLASWRIPGHVAAVPEPVLYAEALFGETLAQELGVELSSPPEDWLVRLPPEYLGRSVRLGTLGQARALPEPAFIKPPNDKSFPARVYAQGELPTGYDEDMAVLVSGIVDWESEFRCFVLDRELQAFSVYSRHGELQREAGYEHSPEEADGVTAFLRMLLADERVDLPRASVVDVGWIAGHGWAVVEQNAAWGAGIYGCDPVRCLETIRHASVKTRAA